MADAPPSIPRIGDVPVPAPFFLRQFRTPGAWGESQTPVDERVEQAISRGFDVTRPKQSLFYVATDDDYRRVVVGMCEGRDNPTKDPFCFAAFTSDELAAVGIVPELVREDMTGCYMANRRLHYDANTTDEALRQLCRNAFEVARPLVRLLKPELSALAQTAAGGRCPACPQNRKRPTLPPCLDAACLALPAPAG